VVEAVLYADDVIAIRPVPTTPGLPGERA